MEPYIADLLNNKKIPKVVRYLITILICGFVVFLGISCALNSEMLWGKIFGWCLTLLMVFVCIFLIIKIKKN